MTQITESRNEKLNLYKELITRQLRLEVKNKIQEFIQEHIDEVVEDLAADAVRNWATKMQMAKESGFDQRTKIQIDFVKEVVKTIQVDNPITIKVG